jgi:hypothetical protein
MRPRILLRDTADIDRLAVHLVTHWRRPFVDLRIDHLPALESHRAQDEFARLSLTCNCTVGEALGGLTLLTGSSLACVGQAWSYLWWTLAATVLAVLVGKGLETLWNRWCLLRLVWNLRRRLSDPDAGSQVELTTATLSASRTYDYPLNSGQEEMPQPRLSRRPSTDRPDRPKLLLRNASDVDRAVRHLLRHWKVPRVVIQTDEVPPQSLQRAQDRLVRLSAGYSHQFAGALAFATFVVSMTYAMWPPEQAVLWKLEPDWGNILMALLITFLSALLGSAIEILWIRIRLLRALRGLRRQLSGA